MTEIELMPDQKSISSTRLIWVTISAVILLFIIFTFALRMLIFFSFGGTDPSAKVVVAGISVLGGFLGALVTFGGVLLKHSLDQRTENRLELESQRNDVLRKEAEQRLRLEAAIRAVQLFATSNGDLAPNIQRTGALFTLSSLGQHELTIALTTELFRAGLLEPSSVARLINQALIAGNDEEKERAIDIFVEHAERMLTPEGVEIPTRLWESTKEFSLYVRGWVPIALGKLMLARPVGEWSDKEFYLTEILVPLAISWLEEKDDVVRRDSGAILKYILRMLPEIQNLQLSKSYLDVGSLRSEVEDVFPVSGAAREVVSRLETWIEGR